MLVMATSSPFVEDTNMEKKLEEKFDEILQPIKVNLESIRNSMERGFVTSDIVIQAQIPQRFVDGGSIRASQVGADIDLTAFLRTHVIRRVDEDWKPFTMPAEASPTPFDRSELEKALEKDNFAYMNIESDNPFNIKVNIRDPQFQKCHFVSRMDGVILPHKAMTNLKDDTLRNIVQYAVAFVEIESGEKGMDNAGIQLLSSLMAMAACFQHQCLYGVVIDRTFTQARLVKYYQQCCLADGIFHPSALPQVARKILESHP